MSMVAEMELKLNRFRRTLVGLKYSPRTLALDNPTRFRRTLVGLK